MAQRCGIKFLSFNTKDNIDCKEEEPIVKLASEWLVQNININGADEPVLTYNTHYIYYEYSESRSFYLIIWFTDFPGQNCPKPKEIEKYKKRNCLFCLPPD